MVQLGLILVKHIRCCRSRSVSRWYQQLILKVYLHWRLILGISLQRTRRGPQVKPIEILIILRLLLVITLIWIKVHQISKRNHSVRRFARFLYKEPTREHVQIIKMPKRRMAHSVRSNPRPSFPGSLGMPHGTMASEVLRYLAIKLMKSKQNTNSKHLR